MFPIYASPKSFIFDTTESAASEPFSNIAFDMESAGVPLFGCQAFGIHLPVCCYLEQVLELTKYDKPTKTKEKT